MCHSQEFVTTTGPLSPVFAAAARMGRALAPEFGEPLPRYPGKLGESRGRRKLCISRSGDGLCSKRQNRQFHRSRARAADAGYRLIIVLAGTWNILRNQTQRRFDKELLGKELLTNDESYSLHPPPDWDEFLEHGARPSNSATTRGSG